MSELLALLDALLNGSITDDQHRRLEEMLVADPEARRAYFAYLDLHLDLRRLHAPETQPLEQLKRDLGQMGTAARAPRRRALWIAAAVLLAAAGLYLAIPAPKPAPAAVCSQTAAARFYGGSSLNAGATVELAREYALTSGRVELRFGCGAEAILEGPAVFAVRDAARLGVKFGACSVHAPKGAEGFVVETPLTRVVDRGTRFAIDVGEGGETEVQVLEGKAEVESRGSASLLEKGAGRRFGHAETREATLDATRFPLEMPDRVIRYDATERPGTGGGEDLRSVTVRRGGVERTYALPELIGIDLIHFKSQVRKGTFVSTVTDGPVPDGVDARRALLDRDANLNTGVVNPGYSANPLTKDPVMNDPEDPARPNTPGMGIRFQRPVVNGPGPDIVLFEYQPVIQPEHGDAFHASPLQFRVGLRSHTIRRWDLGTYSPEARFLAGFRLNTFAGPVGSLSAFGASSVPGGTNWTVPAKILAVGVDLSDLGYGPGESVEGFFLQDADDNNGHYVDPTFIAGLP